MRELKRSNVLAAKIFQSTVACPLLLSVSYHITKPLVVAEMMGLIPGWQIDNTVI